MKQAQVGTVYSIRSTRAVVSYPRSSGPRLGREWSQQWGRRLDKIGKEIVPEVGGFRWKSTEQFRANYGKSCKWNHTYS